MFRIEELESQLAEYYYRINYHLLGDVRIMELCVDTNVMRTIKE